MDTFEQGYSAMAFGDSAQLKVDPEDFPGDLSDRTQQPAPNTLRDVGRILSGARQEKDLTIKQVASKIHVLQPYLIALEAGNLSELPGRVYVLGFIRNYARLLELDADELIRQLNKVTDFHDFERAQGEYLQKKLILSSEEGPSYKILVISLILVVLTGVGGYFFINRHNVESDVSQIVPKEAVSDLISLSSETPPSEPALGESQVVTNSDKAEDIEAQISQILENTLDKPLIAQEETPVEPSVKPVPPVMAVAPQLIRIKANARAWIEIRDAKDKVLVEKTLQPGQDFIVPKRPGLTLNTGNAGGIDIYQGDVKQPALGGIGDVKRGVKLD